MVPALHVKIFQRRSVWIEQQGGVWSQCGQEARPEAEPCYHQDLESVLAGVP